MQVFFRFPLKKQKFPTYLITHIVVFLSKYGEALFR